MAAPDLETRTRYDPAETETRVFARWRASGLFHPEPAGTLDERYAQAVLRVFVALYEKGYIYRDNRMVNWDPGLRSAVSDLEVEEREVTDTLYSIDYPLASGHGSVTI